MKTIFHKEVEQYDSKRNDKAVGYVSNGFTSP